MMRSFIGLVLAAAAVIAVCGTRFNQRDLLIGRWTGPVWDAYEYTAFVEYLRGEASPGQLTAPFVYRPLVPWLAAQLPAEPLTAINLINVTAIWGSAIILYRMQRVCGAGTRWSAAGCAMFIFSFPTFYYGSIGLVDPVLVLCIALATYSLVRDKWPWFHVAFVVGLLTKESAVILLPVALSYLILQRRMPWRRVAIAAIWLACVFLAVTLLTRLLYPADSPAYVWSPAWTRIVSNITRLKTWASFMLSLGLPGLLGVYAASHWKQAWFQERRQHFGPLLVGMAMSFALFAYAMVSAYADGRFIWLSYPFAIPLATSALSLRHQNQRKDITTEDTEKQGETVIRCRGDKASVASAA